jgi:hypothetical protein
VPLADHPEETLNRAMKEAVETAVQGATAMGLSWIWERLEDRRWHAAMDAEENGTHGGTRGLNRSGLPR